MTEAVVPMQAIHEKVKERIRSAFVDMIPAEMWDGLIKANIDAYLKTELPALVKKLAQEEIERRIRDQFAKPEWQNQWNQFAGHNAASQMVERIVREAAPLLVQEMFSGMVQNIVQLIRNNQLPRY